MNDLEQPDDLGENSAESAESSPSRPSQADLLVQLAKSSGMELFHDRVGDGWARIEVDGHYEVRRLRSRPIRQYLAKLYWTGCQKAVGNEAINAALNLLGAIARFQGPRHELHNRVAWHKGAIYYDLTDHDWRAVRISTEGWEIVDEPPILFQRFAHQAPQVEPEPMGDLRDLLRLINVHDESTQTLLVVYWVSLYLPDIPHVIPVVYGPQGSAKTTCLRMFRRLVDPSITETLSLPRNLPELVQQLSHHWMAVYDNLGQLPNLSSDALCRACTGEGFSKRELYSDDDDVIYSFRRCIALNGINVAAQKADLLDRSLLIRLSPIPEERRRPEEQLWREFEEARPYLLGAAMDALVRAMSLEKGIELDSVPRMADFSRWGCAIAEALGIGQELFLKAYRANMADRNQEVLTSSPVAAVLTHYFDDLDEWEGTATQLLAELTDLGEGLGVDTKARNWPKAANALTRRLNEIVPNLAAGGIEVDTTGYRDRQRLVRVRRVPGNTVDTVAEAASSGEPRRDRNDRNDIPRSPGIPPGRGDRHNESEEIL